MIPRIKNIETASDYKLIVTFDDGFRVCYDVKEDIDTIEEFKGLEWIYGLWQQVKLDSSCTLGVAGHPAAKNLMYSS